MSKSRKIAAYAVILALMGASVALACTLFSGAYVDFANMCGTALNRFLFYFCKLFGIDANINVPGIAPPIPPPGGGGDVLPGAPGFFGVRFEMWGNMLISGDTYVGGGYTFLKYLMQIMQISMIVVPIIIIMCIIVKKLYYRVNTRHGKETLPLRMHNKLSTALYTPIANTARDTKALIRGKKELKVLFLLVWAFNFNIATMLLNTLSFYLYFVISFAWKELYYVLVSLISELRYLAIGGGFILIIGGLWLFCKWRKSHALNKLESLERENKATLLKRAISTYKWGAMGTCKTMTLTDQSLSLAVMDIEKAEELKTVCRKMFPYFKWILFELDIESKLQDHTIFNWATTVDYVDVLQEEFNDSGKLFKYKYKKYGIVYNNGSVDEDIFKVLKDYARLHMLYTQSSSFIISNYPIREDRVMMSEGNTVLWDNSFFNFNKTAEDSFYSKILNFDYLRLSRTFKEAASNKSLEFGIICITEDDKEQTNAVETQNDSANSPYPNPKNDGINKSEKFIRHRGTIMGHCFVHLLKDGQRVMSINADTREISTLEHMLRPKKEKSALPMFFIEKAMYFAYGAFYKRFETKMRYYRGDDTLLMHMLKTLDKWLYNNYYRKYNRYTYKSIEIESEDGIMNGEKEVSKYYLMNAKILANRYNTATHESFFYERSRQSGAGIRDYAAYKSSTMSDDEFDAQNSYNRLSMTDPNWRQPYIDEEKRRQSIEQANNSTEAIKITAIARAEAKVEAAEIVKARKNSG